MSQSPGERQRLRTIWEAHPKVKAFYKAMNTYARDNDLSYDVAGMNALTKFRILWIREHGPLPDSGIEAG